MKPVHHALVSARLFGGTWNAYEPLHTAFDSSKAALGDMRHRAALHSLDHGGAVMAMRFADTSFPGASLTELVAQHIDDDQGFPVYLDTWLAACRMPVSLSPQNSDSAWSREPALACAAKWGGNPEDYAALCTYLTLPTQFSDHPLAPAIALNTFGIFFAESIFGPALSITHNGRTRPVSVRDIGEDMAMDRYGHLPTLAEVFSGMKKQDWMMGARVEKSRARRVRKTGISNLFSMAD